MCIRDRDRDWVQLLGASSAEPLGHLTRTSDGLGHCFVPAWRICHAEAQRFASSSGCPAEDGLTDLFRQGLGPLSPLMNFAEAAWGCSLPAAE
eukprot:8864394-Alexandrium_andersonii.AAC.1